MVKLLSLFLLTLCSCALQVDNPADTGDTSMEHGWNPPPTPQEGFHEERNYNQPSNRQKEKFLPAWQANVRVQSSSAQLGNTKALMSISFPEPGVYTAQFSITQPSQLQGGTPTASAVANIRCQAILSWVVEGNQVQRIFDIGNGTTISGAAAGVIIQVQDLTVTLPGGGTGGFEYQVSVSVTKGTRAQFQVPLIQPGAASTVAGIAQPIPNPIGPVALAPGALALFPVPVSAGVIAAKVMVRDVTTPATRPTFVQAQQRSDPVGLVIYGSWVPDIDPGFVPMVPGAQLLIIINGSGADTVSVTVDWAIDG